MARSGRSLVRLRPLAQPRPQVRLRPPARSRRCEGCGGSGRWREAGAAAAALPRRSKPCRGWLRGWAIPDRSTQRNRHNIGFKVVEELARKAGSSVVEVRASKAPRPRPAMIGRTHVRARQAARVHEPLGLRRAARDGVSHGRDRPKLLVVHDEIDLDFGIVRLKNGGGHGGHNGLRSIMEQLGEGGFSRLRMGVGRDPNKPPGSARTPRRGCSVISPRPRRRS